MRKRIKSISITLSYRKGLFDKEGFSEKLKTCKYAEAIYEAHYMEEYCSKWYFEDKEKYEISLSLDKKYLNNETEAEIGNYFNQLAKPFDTVYYPVRDEEYNPRVNWTLRH